MKSGLMESNHLLSVMSRSFVCFSRWVRDCFLVNGKMICTSRKSFRTCSALPLSYAPSKSGRAESNRQPLAHQRSFVGFCRWVQIVFDCKQPIQVAQAKQRRSIQLSYGASVWAEAPVGVEPTTDGLGGRMFVRSCGWVRACLLWFMESKLRGPRKFAELLPLRVNLGEAEGVGFEPTISRVAPMLLFVAKH